jgi:hypothetical protein
VDHAVMHLGGSLVGVVVGRCLQVGPCRAGEASDAAPGLGRSAGQRDEEGIGQRGGPGPAAPARAAWSTADTWESPDWDIAGPRRDQGHNQFAILVLATHDRKQQSNLARPTAFRFRKKVGALFRQFSA